jgi:hypothetical protein
MGLKIEYYSNVTTTGRGDDVGILSAGSWIGHLDGLPAGQLWAQKSGSFYVGSYKSYGAWREALAKFAGYAVDTPAAGPIRMMHAAACWNGATGPFSELINFSDCDGALGPVVCAKLYGDFSMYLFKAIKEDLAFFTLYEQFMTAFFVASKDNGFVRFC